MVNINKSTRTERFNIFFRIQHILMFISVIALVITAIPLWCLRYPHSLALTGIIDFFGGLESIRTWHHLAGWMLAFAFAYHLLYVFLHPEGRRDFLLMLPRRKDFLDLYHNILYFIGKRNEPPQFGRFSYFEKFDYWAAFWGCVIMIGTGSIMLYPQNVSCFFPENWGGKILDVALEAHFHEAILAALALFIWHMFNVHFKPERFPGSMMWLHGHISDEERQKEHPMEDEEIDKHKTFKGL
ncbi:MAG: formate dehydrogenase subunit gamma [Thermodesulfovibrionales bacterium]